MKSSVKKTKILILTSSTGGGHNARANALEGWFSKLYPEGTEIRIEKLIENSAKIGKFGVSLCNWIDVVAPVLHYAYWPIVEIVGQMNRVRLLFGKEYYEEVLKEYQPHVIISVHDFLNYGYFEVARKILGNENIKCTTYCGEFSGGFGYSINWTNPRSDLFIGRNEEALKYAHRLGIKKDNSMVFSSLLGPEEFEDCLSDKEKIRYRKEKLRLDEKKFTVFLATGNNGQNNHIEFLEILEKSKKEVQAIAICGRNEEAYLKLLEWKKANPEFGLHAEGFSNQVHLLIQASNVIVTRGGANTAAKALHYGCPILFNCTQGKMPQERLTINYFKNNGAGFVLKEFRDFQNKIEAWKGFGEDYLSTQRKILKLRNKDEDPTDLIDAIMATANSSTTKRVSEASIA